ncbi:hypothetical protein [Desulforamulus ruminis]|uniref:Uncharacterized protein n=1 Tax=Desulforamulus ruminis (strain ATCC 23193 / DSM 2154 / NCIMB 8452 / DL) TaxID=696281 RepID=F6DM28_DESRL|nr:hypothetical protein [Desulforamulus ruminis]AEG59370.1 hypothetical protein Desru_1095 [Desulforamulus ruminis DSM 2154]
MVRYNVPAEPPKPAPFAFPDGFAGGMNISVTADQIATNQSPDMLNMNYDNGGVPGKRYGFTRETGLGSQPIRGLYEFRKVGQEKPILLVVQDGKLWEIDG